MRIRSSPSPIRLQVGEHCRGRLPLNLKLNTKAHACMSVSPSLQQTIDASTFMTPFSSSMQAPHERVNFICSEPQE